MLFNYILAITILSFNNKVSASNMNWHTWTSLTEIYVSYAISSLIFSLLVEQSDCTRGPKTDEYPTKHFTILRTRYTASCFHICNKPKIRVNFCIRNTYYYIDDESFLCFFFVGVYSVNMNIKILSHFISLAILHRVQLMLIMVRKKDD